MIAPRMERLVGDALTTIARGLAFLGGCVLIGMAVVTVISILGRAFVFVGLRPIKGDFELVEMGCAIAVFAFLPWCQLRRGHVTVDILLDQFSDRVKAVFGLIGDALIAVVSGMMAWQLWLGFAEKFPHGSEGFRTALGMGNRPFYPETSYELEMPVWIPYGLALVGAMLFFIVAIYTVWRALNWVLEGAEP